MTDLTNKFGKKYLSGFSKSSLRSRASRAGLLAINGVKNSSKSPPWTDPNQK